MTISSSYSPDTYAGAGTTGPFAITFEKLLDSNSNATGIKVSKKVDSTGVITLLTITTDYTISGSNVTTVANVASGETLIIELDPDYLQSSDYTANSSLPAETLEDDLDKRTLEAQLNKDLNDRSLRVSSSSSGVTSTIVMSDTNSTNGDKYLKFNSAGTGFELQTLSTSSGLGNLVEDLTPQLGGDLDLNSSDITGTGDINHTGTLTTSGLATVGSFSTAGTAATGTLTVTGNIVVTGTVDGRDVATDGTKLDGIETAADVTDATNVISSLDGATISTATVATGDKVLIQDVDDSDNLKTVTAQSIADLASAASAATQAEQEAGSSTTTFVSPGRQQYHPSAAKAWGAVANSGTPTLEASYNITSLTDNGVGDTTVTIATDFSGADYSVVIQTGGNGTSTKGHTSCDDRVAGSFTASTANAANGSLIDNDFCFTCFGDQ